MVSTPNEKTTEAFRHSKAMLRHCQRNKESFAPPNLLIKHSTSGMEPSPAMVLAFEAAAKGLHAPQGATLGAHAAHCVITIQASFSCCLWRIQGEAIEWIYPQI